MAKKNKKSKFGIFKMTDIQKIEKMELIDAQVFLSKKVHKKESMLDENKKKVLTMISGQKNIQTLMISMANFILAFEDQNLKVVSNFNSALI